MDISRREFFKVAIKKAIPFLGLVVLAPALLEACSKDDDPQGCNNSCMGTAQSGCGSTCSKGCTGSSQGGCGVAMIRLSLLLVLIAVLLVAMAVKTVVMIIVKIQPSLPVARAVVIVVIRLAHKLVRQLVVVHVSQPVWDSARVLVCLDAKPDAEVGAGVTIDTNFE